MQGIFVRELLKLDTIDQVRRALEFRRDVILKGIEEGTVAPGSDAMSELAELNIAIGDVSGEDEVQA